MRYSDEFGEKKLYRLRREGKIAGVCAGMADYFGFSRFGFRCCTVFAFVLFPPQVVIAYFIAAFVMDAR